MKRFFISDTHFGHYNVIGYSKRPFVLNPDESIPLKERQFQLVKQMNQHMIDCWNSVVSDEDEVYFVGDFAFSGTQEMEKVMKSLKGRKILISGNHDKSDKQMLAVGFSEVHNELTLTIADQEVLLCHYPYVDMDFYDIAKKRPNMLRFVSSDKVINPPIPTELDYHQGYRWLKENIAKPINSTQDGAKEYIQFIQRLISKHIGTRPLNEGKILIHGHTHHKTKRFANMINVSVEAWDFIPASEDQIAELISEFEKEINGDFINEDNFTDPVYDYYSKLERKLFKLRKFSLIDELNLTYYFIDVDKKKGEKFKTRDVPQKYSQKWLELNKKYKGFIPLEELENGVFYKGSCRNATYAMWNSLKNKFYYIRNKFGFDFIEDIETVENDIGFDVFIAYEKIELNQEEKEKFNSLWEKYSKP